MSELMEKQGAKVKASELKINWLRLRNFKGLRNFTLDLNGKNASVYGYNRIGKSTLADAWAWLTTGKDSQGQTDFDIKTLDENNNPVHRLEHEVEAEITLNDESLKLKKTYYEKWVKTRGSASESFSGHSTDYAIDEVPVKKSEYDAKIAEIINEDTFRLLTDIRHFNENLNWSDRRNILLSITGESGDQEELENASNEQKKIKAQLPKINKEIQEIPTRIDEVHRSMPDTSDLDKKELVNKQAQIKDAKIKKENELSELESGGAISKKKKEKADLEAKLQEERNKSRGKVYEKINKLDDQIQDKKEERMKVQNQIRNVKNDRDRAKSNEAATKRDIEGIQENIKKTKERTFTPEATTCYACDRPNSCPECGHTFVEDNTVQQEEQFNVHKAESLEELNNELKIKKQQLSDYEAEIKEATETVKNLQKKADKLDKESKELQKKRYELKEPAESKEEQKLTKQIDKVQAEIDSLQASNKDAIAKVQADIEKLNSDLDSVQEQLNSLKSVEQSQNRIKELEAEEKKLAGEYEKLQKQLYDIENLIKAKVTNLEEKINSYFENVTFKMFEVQINEGIKETCETILHGVPYGSLSNSERILCGLDITSTLQRHYQLHVPCIVDNAEAVCQLPDVPCQLIRLVVSEPDKQLRVEVE